MKTLIIGNGEVGKALFKVLENYYPVSIRDKANYKIQEKVEVLHICYPYYKKFVNATKEYIKQYKPKYTVIHSTVPVGTSRKCGAYHSPIIGIHPNLEEGIRTFTKYLAPINNKLAEYFRNAGITIKQIEKPETTELAKILSTTRFGLDIVFNQEVYKLCKQFGADFNIVYTDWTKTYNEGYCDLGQEQFTRPVLKYIKGKIGGHCVLSNCDLLNNVFTSLVKKQNG